MGVTCLPGHFFELGDVFVDFWKPHTKVLYFYAGPIFTLGVLELLRKFMEELFPNQGHIIDDWIELINPSTHISNPSSHFGSFDQCECKRDFLHGGIESCHVLVEAEVSSDFFYEIVGSGAITGEYLG